MKKILFSLFAVCVVSIASAQLQNFTVGQTAPDFTVTDVHGNDHTLYDYTSAGQYVILDFFFVTCGPCQSTAPILAEFHAKYGCNAGDVFVLSIDNGYSDADVLGFEAQYGGTNPNPAASGNEGGGNAVTSTYGPSAFPTMVLIGPDNKLINTDIWPVGSVADLEAVFPGGAITEMSCGTVGINDLASLPTEMQGVYPNPAAVAATIDFSLGQTAEVSFEIFDMMGKKVAVIDIETFEAGTHAVKLPVSTLASGNYFVNMVSGDETKDVSKLVVIK
jgi:thiol-disulfide isomerase/thioredoxin